MVFAGGGDDSDEGGWVAGKWVEAGGRGPGGVGDKANCAPTIDYYNLN